MTGGERRSPTAVGTPILAALPGWADAVPPHTALVYAASLWVGVVAFGPPLHELRARQQLQAAIGRYAIGTSPAHDLVCADALHAITHLGDARAVQDLNATLDQLYAMGRAQPPAAADGISMTSHPWWSA
jgi:hypothetical protein